MLYNTQINPNSELGGCAPGMNSQDTWIFGTILGGEWISLVSPYIQDSISSCEKDKRIFLVANNRKRFWLMWVTSGQIIHQRGGRIQDHTPEGRQCLRSTHRREAMSKNRRCIRTKWTREVVQAESLGVSLLGNQCWHHSAGYQLLPGLCSAWPLRQPLNNSEPSLYLEGSTAAGRGLTLLASQEHNQYPDVLIPWHSHKDEIKHIVGI